MKRLHVVALICLMLAACSEGKGLTTEQPADTTRGPGLLLPWSQLTGRIVYATPSAIVLVDTHTRTVKTLYNVLADETPNDVAISPDGKRVAYSALLTSGATRLTIIDALTGTPLSGNLNQSCPRWLEDGRFSYMSGNAVFIETAHAGNLPQQPLSCQTWAPDGSWYAEAALSGAQSDAIYRVDLNDTPARVLLTSNLAGLWYDPAFSPNGQTIGLVQAGNSETTDVFLMNADGSNVRHLASVFRLFGLSWSPDGAMLLGVSTAGSNGSYEKAGLFLIDARNGVATKLVNHPVYAAAWGS